MLKLSKVLIAGRGLRPCSIHLFRLKDPLILASGSYFYCQWLKPFKASTAFQLQPKETPTLIEQLWHFTIHLGRFIYLLLIFAPAILLLPLTWFKTTKDIWISVFMRCVERAGVVWIKAFQYLSHRRDMIGEDMALKFSKLREAAPTHPFEDTLREFRMEFGKDIDQVFDQFDRLPVASGSVSQVYKAIYKGRKVAVKVRHPGVEHYIERDVNILFFISRVLSKISGRFQIPVNSDSLKRTLIQQVDFNIEAQNLKKFAWHFKDSKNVSFPEVVEEGTGETVLVQSFVEGTPITYFQRNKHALNRVIARIGATTFFEMLMKHNFIHADCHGGNIMVSIKEKSSTVLDNLWQGLRKVYRIFQNAWINANFESPVIRQMYKESKRQQDEVRQIQIEQGQKVEVTLIDVGMVIKLNEEDRLNFINFIKSVIQQEPEQCAQMIYSLSLYKGNKIMSESSAYYHRYYEDLKELFSVLRQSSLRQLDGVKLFKSMLDLIREYRMKLDGQFATLLTNMLVLQGMAKDIWPEIQILKCAVPYFQLAQDPV